jgi:catechol 2,3-dioxygenase-like lactoylglutathione lyase family enzyme
MPPRDSPRRRACGNVTRALTASGARGRYPEPVAVWVFKVALPPGKTLFIDRNPELLRDCVDVVDVQVDKGVGPCVTGVLREVETHASARYRNEPRKPRLELMLPLLQESESFVPGHGPLGVFHIQHWDDLFLHASQPIRAARNSIFAWASLVRAVEVIDTVVAGLRARGAELVGELERYEDSYRLCYVRGPEGIIIELAEQIG